MDRDTLLALAARVEAAAGADRALDRAIAMAAMPPERRGMYVRRHYTASLDAAASLVPEGWQWVVGQNDSAPVGTAFAIKDRALDATGATPALALTAAALRARAEEARDE